MPVRTVLPVGHILRRVWRRHACFDDVFVRHVRHKFLIGSRRNSRRQGGVRWQIVLRGQHQRKLERRG